MTLLDRLAEIAMGMSLFPGGSSEFAVVAPLEESEWMSFATQLGNLEPPPNDHKSCSGSGVRPTING